MSNVYVVQEVRGRDIAAATSFGELVLLLEHGDVVLSTAPTVRRLREALRNFNDSDYLLLMGDPVAIGLATAIAAEANQGRVKFLKWSRIHTGYIPVKAELNRTGLKGDNDVAA